MSKEARLVKQLSKKGYQKQTPIATDMFLPNHSGNHGYTDLKNIQQYNTTDTDNNFYQRVRFHNTTEAICLGADGAASEIKIRWGAGTCSIETADGKAFRVNEGNSRCEFEGVDTLYDGTNSVTIAQCKTAYDHSQTVTGNPHNISYSDIGTVDISANTNLVAGTNITLVDDTLNVDDSFLINDGDDTTTGKITMAGATMTADLDMGNHNIKDVDHINYAAEDDVQFFQGHDFDDGLEDGKRIYIHRKSTEGNDASYNFYINKWREANISVSGAHLWFKGLKDNGNMYFRSGNYTNQTGTQNLCYYGYSDLRLFYNILENPTKNNRYFRQYGWVDGVKKYIEWKFNDTDENFVLSREDSAVKHFEIGIPVELSGDAKVTKDLWLGTGGFKTPGTKPATQVDLGIADAWEFTDGTDDTLYARIKLPNDMDKSVAPTVSVGWSTPTADAGNCRWQVEYLYRQVDEDMTAAADATLVDNFPASSTANGLVVSEVGTLAVPHANDVCITMRIKRRADEAADTLGEDNHLLGLCVEYTSNKLGT